MVCKTTDRYVIFEQGYAKFHCLWYALYQFWPLISFSLHFCHFTLLNNNILDNNHILNGKNLSDELTDNEKRILLELINNPSIPYDTLVVELGISRRTVSRIFASLVEKGFIERIGTNKKGYWKIIK